MYLSAYSQTIGYRYRYERYLPSPSINAVTAPDAIPPKNEPPGACNGLFSLFFRITTAYNRFVCLLRASHSCIALSCFAVKALIVIAYTAVVFNPRWNLTFQNVHNSGYTSNRGCLFIFMYLMPLLPLSTQPSSESKVGLPITRIAVDY